MTFLFFNLLIFTQTMGTLKLINSTLSEFRHIGLGDRVLNWVTSVVKNRKEPLGADKITHDIRIVE